MTGSTHRWSKTALIAVAIMLALTQTGTAGPLTAFLVGFHASLPQGPTYCNAFISSANPSINVLGVRTLDEQAFKACVLSDPNAAYAERDSWYNGGWEDSAPSNATTVEDILPYVPNDPHFRNGSQYGPVQIRANLAWRNGLGGTHANLCIVDSGVRYTHEELQDNWRSGFDFVNNDSDTWDDNGHGTKMAGIAAATINNSKGIAGLANVGLFVVKAGDSEGQYSNESVQLAITWCANNAGPRTVISMSFRQGNLPSESVLRAIRYAYNDRGALLVAAAGNCGPNNPNCEDVQYPALYDEVIAVSATAPGSVPAYCSAHHDKVELAAPGAVIFTTDYVSDMDYILGRCGTSEAAAMVSGGAALYWSQRDSINNTLLRERLGQTAYPAGYATRNPYLGYGEIDLECLFVGAIWPCPA